MQPSVLLNIIDQNNKHIVKLVRLKRNGKIYGYNVYTKFMIRHIKYLLKD